MCTSVLWRPGQIASGVPRLARAMAVAPAEADRAAASPEATTSGGAAGVPPLASQARPSRGVLQSDGRPLLRSTAQTCLQCALQAVLCPSAATPEGSLTIRGLDFNEDVIWTVSWAPCCALVFRPRRWDKPSMRSIAWYLQLFVSARCASAMRKNALLQKCTSPKLQ